MDLLSILWTTILPFLVILTIVVFVHEFGHFIVARWNGVKVDVFSIGFGRELFGWNDRHGTRWRVSLLPLGGYVKFFGDANEASAGSSDAAREMSAEDRAVSFHHKRVGQRIAVVVAGPGFNFLFAIAIFAAVFMTVGQPTTAPILGGVQPGSAAAEAGLLPGDRIVTIDGHGIDRFEDIQRLVPLNAGTPMQVEVLRDSDRLDFQVTPRITEMTDGFGNVHRTPILGVSVSSDSMEMHRLGPVAAVGSAVGHTWGIVSSTMTALGQMVTGARGTDDLGGPVRIAQFSGQAAQSGVVNAIMFVALLSVALGLFNLFPVPMLDGGHLVFYIVEALRGRPLSERVQEYGFRLGFALVVCLMVFVTWNDIVRLIEG